VSLSSISKINAEYHDISELTDKRYLLQRAERDHLDWAIELSNSIFLKTPFNSQLDYTLCRFGKWYYSLGNISDTGELAIYKKIEAPHKALHDTGKVIMNLLKEGKTNDAINYYKEHTVMHLSKIKGILKNYRDYVNARTNKKKEIVNKDSKLIIKITALVSFIILIITVILSILIIISIAKPLKNFLTIVKDISEGEGDLTKRLDIKSKDEIGEVSVYFDKFIGNIENMVIQIKDSAVTLSASTVEISSSSQNLADISQNQAATVEENTASIHELTGYMDEILKTVTEAKIKSEKLLNIASANKTLVDNANESMGKINENSAKISEILTVINDIADQTNLLALNASIEAARAGEHGRGFSVVADEISKLADKSSENAKEIEKLVKQNINDAKHGNTAVEKTGEAFAEIISGIDGNNSMMNKISTSISQQESGTKELQRASENINEITQNVSASAEELSATAEEIQALSSSLEDTVKMFKVSSK
jgi:methyl-accepting chemotaxis protein